MILEIITIIFFLGIIIYFSCIKKQKKLSEDEKEYLKDFTW